MNWLRTVGLRIALSLGLSFSLWAFVSFSENPDRRTPFESVPVAVEDLSPGLVLVDENGLPRPSLPNVSVILEADAATLASVRPSDIRALVNLSKRGPGDYTIPVVAATNRSDLTRLSFADIEPDFLPVRLEQLITNTVPLTMVVQGSPPFSFERGEPQVRVDDREINEVQVRGPKSRVEQVASVQAIADINDLRGDYTSLVRLKPLDASGQVVEGVTVQPEAVQVRVPIRSVVGLRRVAVLVNVVGLPAAGYSVSGIFSDPQLVNLTGSSGPLDDVLQIETEPVTVAGATRTLTREVGLRLPLGTSLQAGEPSKVQVTITIVSVVRPFQVVLPVPVQVLDAGGLLVSLSPQIIQVPLTGSSRSLTLLDTTALLGTVSVAGLGPGTYSLTPELALPSDVRVAGETPKVTVTLQQPPSPTVQPTRTISPTDDTSRTPTEVPTEPPSTATQVTTPTQQPATPTQPPATPEQPLPTPEQSPETEETTAPTPDSPPVATPVQTSITTFPTV